MNPPLGRGRLQEPDQLAGQSSSLGDPARDQRSGDTDVDDADLVGVEISRPPDSAPIRPDLGPPAPGPQSANQPGSGLGLVISIAISAIVFVLAIYATGGPTPNPLPLAQTTNALFWFVAALATIGAGVGAVFADRTASRP